MNQAGKYILFIGIVAVIIGLIIIKWGDKLPPLGRLPGDIVIKKENFSFYFPITTMIIASLVLTLIMWIIRRFNI